METRAEALRRGVSDTLDSIVSPAVRDTLLREALGLASLKELPTESGALFAFLSGPLRRTLERALGRELGRSVTEELQRLGESLPPPLVARTDIPVREARLFTLPAGTDPAETPDAPGQAPPSERERLARALSERERLARAPTQPSRPAVRLSDPRPPASGDFPTGTANALGIGLGSSAPPPSRLLPMVFIATRDPELARRFSAWLDPRVVVVRVSRLIDLLLDLEDVGARRTVIVFDHRKPPFRVEALAAVAEELPDESRVLSWGASREAHAELTRVSTRVTRWIACPENMPLADVVERCSKLVG